jgi:outer membrane protein OmpU
MKKVLLATTALTLSAGIASADGHAGMSVSGFTEIGIFDNGTDDVQFFQDIDVTFSGSGTTDSGLTFGFSIDLDEVQQNDSGTANGAVDNVADDGGASIFISGDFGTLTMGDTDGALDWALTEVGSLGSIADDHTAYSAYSGNGALDGSNDGQVLRYDNTIGDFSFAISMEQDVDHATATTAIALTGSGDGDVLGLGVKGSFGDISVGLGFQSDDTTDVIGLSVGATFGDIAAVVNWWDLDDGAAGETYTALGLTYTSGPLGLHVNYASRDEADIDGFGLAVNYDLGGGAEVQFGYGSDDTDDTWSLGVAMSF